jgi:predicted NUDIX family phosphoesterase
LIDSNGGPVTSTDEIVIVVPAERVRAAGVRQGFDPAPERILAEIFQPGVSIGLPRSRAEVDPTYKQLVGYVVLRCVGRVFNYRRVKGGGESRLTGRRSVGLGGHLNLGDIHGQVDRRSLERSIRRELQEEVVVDGEPTLDFVGILNDDTTDVSRVHLGVVVAINLSSTLVSLRDPTLADGAFDLVSDLRNRSEEFEDWSRLCFPWLSVPE